MEQQTLLLEAGTYKRLATLPKMHFPKWSPDSTMIAEADGNLSIFHREDGRLLLSISNCCAHSSLSRLTWAPGGGSLIAARFNSGVQVYEVPSGRVVTAVPDIESYCDSIAWSPDGTRIAACGNTSSYERDQSALRVCEVKSGKELLRLDSTRALKDASWSPDGKFFAYCGNSVHLLDGVTYREVIDLGPEENHATTMFWWSPDGKLIAYKTGTESLHVFDVASKKEIALISAEKTGRYAVRWSPDSKVLLVISWVDNQVALFGAVDGQLLGARKLAGLTSADWTPDGKSIAVFDGESDSVSLIPVGFESGQVALEGGTKDNPWKNQKVPKNLDDCFRELEKYLGKEGVERLKNSKENELYEYTASFGISMALRNTWGLNDQTPIAMYFRNMGINDGRTMSTIIIESFWRHLNSKPVALESYIDKYKLDEESQKVLLHEDIELSKELREFQATTLDGKPFSISKLGGTVKVVCFVNEIMGPSMWMLNGLQELRKKYPESQVTMAVFKFTPADIDISHTKMEGDCSDQIATTISQIKDRIPVATGSKALLNALYRQTQGRIRSISGGLPQALVIDDSGLVVTRFNTWYPDAPEAFAIQVDRVLKKAGMK
ncbi:MAG: DUF6794 domain-containing protein [Candidatus Obscuribacterales bacterium]